MKKITLLFLILVCANCFSQFSKTHYIPPLSNSDSQEPQGQFMYISCPSLTPVNFKITQLGSSVLEGTVSRDTPYVFSIGAGFDTQLLVSQSNVAQVMSNKGYIVEAEDQVYVTVRMTTTPQHFQAGGLVSKGLAALGTEFRIGAFTNTSVPSTNDNHYTFASILATENNTTIHFSDIKPNVSLINSAAGSNPPDVLLNRGESYVIAVQGPTDANRDGLIGALVSSDKPIALNCGSIAGTDGDANNLDLGFDQIVSAERTGTEYIFIKGVGPNIVERPMIIAHQDNTDVYLNGDFTTPVATLMHGQYLALDGSQYSANGNLYVKTSQKVFAYQGIGGSNESTSATPQANQNMSFVPPLNCETPKIIDNIPFINEIGNNATFTGTVAIVTETSADLNFIINGTPFTIASLPGSIVTTGPTAVIGNPDFVTYTFQGLTGNISVYSTRQVYLSYFGSSGAATYGGFYSGFTFKPEIAFNKLDATSSNCIPNAKLSVNTLTAFDDFQWYFNDVPIPGATSNSYIPTEIFSGGLGPGFYHVKAGISSCNTQLISDKIPVSSCASDTDNDGVNDNIDGDTDNDGIVNCTESYGNKDLDLTAASTGTVATGNYTNSFTHTTASMGPQPATPYTGATDGSFVTETKSGIGNAVSEIWNFTSPISLSLEYVTTANAADLLSPDGNFIVQVPVDKTITVLNPDDQLLIDTNYDGIFESGITQFSSFEVRFRLNNGAALPAGTGTFRFMADLVDRFSYTHKNLSDTDNNKATFRLIATCVPKNTDGDQVSDQRDFDSDNDGIPDNIEALGANFIAVPFIDANLNGINDSVEPGLTPIDTDGDGVMDYTDLDSDNDGIYDLVESGSGVTDANNDGKVDGNIFGLGTNGFEDSLETIPESGVINYTLADTDGVGIQNYIDLDSDNDACLDVTEAGFSDGNFDGMLGNAAVIVNTDGLVTNGTGYTAPNPDYLLAAPIIVVTPPQDQTRCADLSATFTIDAGSVNGYKWQQSTDGISYSDITDNANFSGSNTNTLQITGLTTSMNNYRYRVFLSKAGNTCGLYSASADLTILPRPVVPANITLVQCDDDLDGLSDFNLTQKESLISANAANETFTYFTTENAAKTADANFQIANFTAYNNASANIVWVRIQNNDGCFNTTRLDLVVSATQIPAGTSWSFAKCDDYVDAANDDRDGISTFDFSQVTADIDAILLNNPNYTIAYYKNQADALAETDASGNSLAIANISAYRNTGYPNQQLIWVRVDSNIDNACFGLGPYVKLTVEALPFANPVVIPRACDDSNADAVITHAFDTSFIETALLNGQSNVTVAYTDANNNPLPSPLPNPFITATQAVTVRVTNNVTVADNGPCYDETVLQFTVDALPVANPVTIAPGCDDAKPDDKDGLYDFDTATVQGTLLGAQTGFTVRYIAENGTILPSPLPNPFKSGTQNVTAIVENPLNTSCAASTVIVFVVNPLPEIERDFSDFMCHGPVNEVKTLYAGLVWGNPTDYTYEWYRNGTLLPSAQLNQLTVHEDGIYTTKIIRNTTGCFRIRTNTIVYSEIAQITDVIIRDLTQNNTVNIIATGLGTYEYSIDNPYGPFQSSPLFENVAPGLHDLYVNDVNDCGIVSKLVSVVGAPLFFTPNGDGYNDTWKVKGVNPVFYKNTVVYIFDRFGKLLKEIPGGSDEGWDGTYNGKPIPADDYWFVIYLDDGRIGRGHFALKR